MRSRALLVIIAAAFAASLPAATGIKVVVSPAGPVRITTPAAEFELRASGYLRGRLLKGEHPLTLDDPLEGPAGGGD